MTVVRETTQSEKDQVLTRVVTNNNHMHAMSVQYYEVVQVYNVTTKPTKLERCLFIPLQELTFTYSSLQRYKEVLASVAPAEWAAKIRAAVVRCQSMTATLVLSPGASAGLCSSRPSVTPCADQLCSVVTIMPSAGRS
jgi:hypothetical protein